jgi:hypothetical protein
MERGAFSRHAGGSDVDDTTTERSLQEVSPRTHHFAERNTPSSRALSKGPKTLKGTLDGLEILSSARVGGGSCRSAP